MKKDMPDIKITAFNDLFSTEEARQAEKHGAIVNISIAEIDDFNNHPFKVEENADMRTLKNSIIENGVISPCIVRKKENGRYEMISGHRRKFASTLAGLSELPCIVKKLNDEEAIVLMVDSNSYREYILLNMITPSHAQAIQLRALQASDNFSSDTVYKILSQAKPNQIKDKRISTTRFKPFFSDNISLRKMEEEIIEALKFYRQHNKI